MKNKELENYLFRLEKYLGPIAISEKAEIVIEIKNHVMTAMENNENLSVGQILTSLGEPERVANRYLHERGLEPQKPSKHSIIKWITIGLLGTFGIMAIVFVILIWKFTPVIKVDQERGRVQILGGLVDVPHEDMGRIDYRSNEDKNNFSGEEDLYQSNIKRVDVVFSNGKFDIINNEENKFRFECKIKGNHSDIKQSKSKDLLVLNLSNVSGSYCKLELPPKIRFVMKGKNGRVRLIELRNHISINIWNGNIDFSQDPNSQYKYQTSIANGSVDDFLSSDSEEAFNVEFSLVNGRISKF